MTGAINWFDCAVAKLEAHQRVTSSYYVGTCPQCNATESCSVRLAAANDVVLRCRRRCARDLLAKRFGVPLDHVSDTPKPDRELRHDVRATLEGAEHPLRSEWSPFPTTLLPEPLASFVRATARSIDVDECLVALPALVACAGTIGNARRVRVKRGYSQPSVLWGLTIAGSGTGKSPAWNAALAPLKDVELRHASEFERAVRRQGSARARCNTNRSRQVEAENPSQDAGEAAQELKRARLLVNDLTIEGLARALAENPRGLICSRDELSGFFRGFDQYRDGRGGDLEHWLEIHGAEPLNMLRADLSRCVDVPRAAVSIVGGLQPVAARRVFTREQVERGLLARFLVVRPPHRAQRPTDFEVPQAVEAAYPHVLHGLLSLRLEEPSDAVPCPTLDATLTPSARDAFRGFEHECAERIEAGEGDAAAGWSKLKGYALRLALVIHLVRFVCGDAVNELQLDQQSMRTGVDLARWFGREAERVLATLSEAPDDTGRRELVEWIRQRGAEVTVRDLQRGRSRYRTADSAQRGLDDLASRGLGVWHYRLPGPRGGAPSRVFKLRSYSSSTDGNPERGGCDAGSVGVDGAERSENGDDDVEGDAG